MAREASPIKARSAEATPTSWPVDANGEPMIQITVQASELIGLQNYSNITIGPANITLFVPKGQEYALEDDDAKALANAVNQLAEIVEVDVIANQRDIALGTIDPSKQ